MKFSVAPLSIRVVIGSADDWYVVKLHFIFKVRRLGIYIVPIFRVLTTAVSLDPSKNLAPVDLL